MTAFTLPHRALVAMASAAILLLAACSGSDGGGDASGVKVDPYLADVVMGDPNAPVKIVEYASLTCPHCRDFWKQELPRLKADYIDTGKASYVLRELPTAPAEVATAAAAIARCGGKDKYYDIIDDFVSSFFDLMDATTSPQGAGPVLIAVAGRHGITPDQVQACVDHKATQAYIEKSANEGAEKQKASGSNRVSTPAVFVNDTYVPNLTEKNYENLAAEIEKKLNPNATPAAPAPTEGAPPATPPASAPARPPSQ